MATIVLSALGATVGASLGGGILGLSSVVIGRAVGATVGRAIDQSIMGGGSEAVETGRIDRFRLMGASEGAPVARVFGRMRMRGQVIWASEFRENVATSGGGKNEPTVREYSYSVSLAVAVCEGQIGRIGRVWADGQEVASVDLVMRVYDGSEDQLPDPVIEVAGDAPAYRGTAYVVFEDLDLTPFGGRVPTFNFEVTRPEPVGLSSVPDLAQSIRGVAMMPGSGEYVLASEALHVNRGPGVNDPINVNSGNGLSDFKLSVDALTEEVPGCESVSLIVSWFGDDLRCGSCQVQPKVEATGADAVGMPWSVSGLSRGTAADVPEEDERPIYGGTPTDRSVIQAIQHLKNSGQSVVLYPFLLMDQLDANGLDDPWSDAVDQPRLPWRGRITVSEAPGRAGSPDQTAQAAVEVAAFFGTAVAGDFSSGPNGVGYSGPAENSYRRFILHYAHLCAAAGGVDAFCIGSEMRGLTQVRDDTGGFPAVAALQALAADVRGILGTECKIGYAADWSEYFGYHPQDGSGDVYFHLDPLWADSNVDFVGIDNYMPLSDWRAGDDHADADWGAIWNLDYLKSNIEGGEGYDWYYPSANAEVLQQRTPITDGEYGEPWVWRYKDIRGWWENPHHERIGGVRQASPTAWAPGGKPVWFTEYGCAAVDKGTNEPNKFLDPKSSESSLPKHSDGRRDDLIQMQYVRAVGDYWSDPAKNPLSGVYGGPMIDMGRAHVWAWDARPYPYFPANTALWSDGANYAKGHWLTGRVSARALASVVAEVCEAAGVAAFDVSGLYGIVRGYVVEDISTGRAALQPLMLAYGFDAVERDGVLVFANRDGRVDGAVDPARLAVSAELGAARDHARSAAPETAGRLRLSYVASDGSFEARSAEAIFPDEATTNVAQSELPLALTHVEARGIVERWLAEARIARDTVQFALPPSGLAHGAGDVVSFDDDDLWRIDRVQDGGARLVDATRVEPGLYQPSDSVEPAARVTPFVPAVPVFPVFLDLPLLTGSEVEHAPHLAVTATPWPGSVAAYASDAGGAFALNRILPTASVIGVTETVLVGAATGVLDRGAALRIKIYGGTLASVTDAQLLAGANALAIGGGASDMWEVLQFRDAVLVGEDTWEVSVRLRGQRGTDALIPDAWPIGSILVLLNGAMAQLDLPAAARGLARTWRVGPGARPVDDASYVEEVRAFDGIGLRPYAPSHLRAAASGGDLDISWVRRTRIDGDLWGTGDVPLGEASEAYLLRVMDGESVVRDAVLTTSAWSYTAAMQAADAIGGTYGIEVAQISDRFGPGLFRRIEIDG